MLLKGRWLGYQLLTILSAFKILILHDRCTTITDLSNHLIFSMFFSADMANRDYITLNNTSNLSSLGKRSNNLNKKKKRKEASLLNIIIELGGSVARYCYICGDFLDIDEDGICYKCQVSIFINEDILLVIENSAS